MPKGSDLLVAALENEGVRRIFGVPGEENLDVVESLRTSSIELIVTRHEQPAAFMAATLRPPDRANPACASATLGPGALNLVTGAAYRAAGRDADDPDHRPETYPQQPSRRASRSSISSQTMRPLTKLVAADRQRRQRFRQLVREAFRIADRGARLGPVHIELPEDIARRGPPSIPASSPAHPIHLPEASAPSGHPGARRK